MQILWFRIKVDPPGLGGGVRAYLYRTQLPAETLNVK